MTFFEIITLAIADIEKYGYDSQERISYWVKLISESIRDKLIPLPLLNEQLRKALTAKYNQNSRKEQLLKRHFGVKSYVLDMIQPKLHAELQRRIVASANLIRLNREEMIERTLRRFEGWATSIPPGGSKVEDTNEIKETVSKSLKNMSFEERRVMIDQGHKLVSNINDIVATEAGAIAGKWRSHWRQPGYDYRQDHKERDQKIYAIRGNWAIVAGLMNKGEGYTDEQTTPGQEPFCRCDYIYIYGLGKLPEDMLTKKGKNQLKLIKGVISEL
jgi:hypothetical protein